MFVTAVKNKVFSNPSAELLKKIHGEGAECREITEAEFRQARTLMGSPDVLYAWEGTVILGNTVANIAAIEKIRQFERVNRQLQAVDRAAGMGRAGRGLAVATAKKNSVTGHVSEKGSDLEILEAFEAEAETLRAQISALTNEISAAVRDAV